MQIMLAFSLLSREEIRYSIKSSGHFFANYNDWRIGNGTGSRDILVAIRALWWYRFKRYGWHICSDAVVTIEYNAYRDPSTLLGMTLVLSSRLSEANGALQEIPRLRSGGRKGVREDKGGLWNDGRKIKRSSAEPQNLC